MPHNVKAAIEVFQLLDYSWRWGRCRENKGCHLVFILTERFFSNFLICHSLKLSEAENWNRPGRISINQERLGSGGEAGIQANEEKKWETKEKSKNYLKGSSPSTCIGQYKKINKEKNYPEISAKYTCNQKHQFNTGKKSNWDCLSHFQVRAELQMQCTQQKVENKFSGT